VSEPLPPALVAFLRGIEPRADVLLRALVGPGLDSDALRARVRTEFAARAARLPLAEWPLRYWGLLLAAPELERPAHDLPRHPLYDLAPTRRLALLLRLVVGLEPPGAARVLGLSETAYRALWNDAEDKLAAAGVGPAVLLRWQEGFQQQIRAAGTTILPAPVVPGPSAPVPRTPPRGRLDRLGRRLREGAGRWRPQRIALGLLLGLLLAALAATFLWPPGRAAPAGGTAAAAPQTLTAPPPREAALEERLLVDPDLDLLLAGADAPWREGVGLLSWWSAQRGDPLPPLGTPVAPPQALPWAQLPAALRGRLAAVESAWPALTPAEQAALLGRAQAWEAATAEQRAALFAAYAAWLARPALERSALRARLAEWRALEPGEQQALAVLAAEWRALPEVDRQALATAFATLPAATREDWGGGLRLGRQWPGLRPLLAFVPAGQQVALIEALAGLSDAERSALAERLATLGAAQRAALRAEVLAAAPAERSDLLRAAAAP